MGLKKILKSLHVHDWQPTSMYIVDSSNDDIEELYEICTKCEATRYHKLIVTNAKGSRLVLGCTYDQYKALKESNKGSNKHTDINKPSSDVIAPEVLVRFDSTYTLPRVYVDREQASVVTSEYKYTTSTDTLGEQYYFITCYLKSDARPVLHNIKIDIVTGKTYFD